MKNSSFPFLTEKVVSNNNVVNYFTFLTSDEIQSLEKKRLLDERRLLEIHYRNLLDDLAADVKAGHHEKPKENDTTTIYPDRRDKLLMLQILQLQEYLSKCGYLPWTENKHCEGAAFLEVEHKRRGELMKVLDGIRIDDLDYGGWQLPHWCGDKYNNRWWPCNRSPANE